MPEDNGKQFQGYVQAKLDEIGKTTFETNESIKEIRKENNEQDVKINSLENNQKWFFRILGVIQAGTLFFFGWLLNKR